MNQNHTEAILILEKIVSKVLLREINNINMDMTALDIQGWDSLNHVQIIYFCEKELGVQFPVKEIQNLKTIGDLVMLISKYL